MTAGPRVRNRAVSGHAGNATSAHHDREEREALWINRFRSTGAGKGSWDSGPAGGGSGSGARAVAPLLSELRWAGHLPGVHPHAVSPRAGSAAETSSSVSRMVWAARSELWGV